MAIKRKSRDVRREEPIITPLHSAWIHGLQPLPIVTAQRLPPGKSNQPRAVALLDIPGLTHPIILELGNRRHPAPEIPTVIFRTKLGSIRKSITVLVTPDDRPTNTHRRNRAHQLRAHRPITAATSAQAERPDQKRQPAETYPSVDSCRTGVFADHPRPRIGFCFQACLWPAS